MQRLQTIAEGISRVGAICGGAMLLVASIVICIDITMRYTVRWTSAAPTSCPAMRWRSPALGLLGGGADALAHPHRYRLRARGSRCGRLLDLLALRRSSSSSRSSPVCAGACCKQSWHPTRIRSPRSRLPLIVPQALWVSGLAFFVLVSLLLLARGLHALRDRKSRRGCLR
jgi:hypothetical protein